MPEIRLNTEQIRQSSQQLKLKSEEIHAAVTQADTAIAPLRDFVSQGCSVL